MNSDNSPAASYSLLGQATTVVVLLQAALILSRIFTDNESSGGMAAILGATLLQFGLTRRLSAEPQGPHATFYVILWRYGALILLGAITLVSAIDTYAPNADMSRIPPLIALLLSALIALKGAMLGKLKPNRVLGLRLRWTRESRLAWDQAHRLMGRILFFGGLMCLVAAPFAPFATFAGLAVLVLISVTSGVIESRRVWQNDPARTIVS
jgi:uncharacterized membrane protein